MSRRGILGARAGVVVGRAFGGAGAFLALLDRSLWAANQYALALSGGGRAEGEVLGFFASEALVLALIALGIFLIYRATQSAGAGGVTVYSIIGAAFSSRRNMKVAIAFGALYTALFSVLSGTVVYQPSVNFASVYGRSGPGYASAVCCGDFGSVPELNVYVAPAYHLGVQLLPLSLLMLVLVPLLVTLNMAVVVESLRQKSMRTGRWVTTLGAFVGLITGCPTCAGYFLLSAAGGLGVTAFTFVLDPYQAAFVAVSIPLLVAGPFLTAYGQKRALAAGCEVPAGPGADRG